MTNARLLGSTGFRSAPSPSRPRPFHHATARSSRADYIAQTRPVPLGAWLRRSATSSVPVLPPSETLCFLRQHPNRSDNTDQYHRHRTEQFRRANRFQPQNTNHEQKGQKPCWTLPQSAVHLFTGAELSDDELRVSAPSVFVAHAVEGYWEAPLYS